MQEIIVAFCMLIVGFVMLIKGADFFVDGASSVAKKLHVPGLIIGLTIVAMGTSLPECAVSIAASISNNNTLAVSNVTGSNIFNLMMVCGLCAIIRPLPVERKTLKKEFPFSVVCAALLLGLGIWGMELGRVDGIVFCAIFVAFIIYMIVSAKKAKESFDGDEEEKKVLSNLACVAYIIGGACVIAIGGEWVVENAVIIATACGISQTVIGLTIVALGTSLPELVTSMVAAKKGESDMALGNVIGSNIFNILLVLGVASAISPIQFLTENIIDIVVLLVMSLVVWIFAWSKKSIGRIEGIVMVALYAAYTVYICIR